MPADPSEGGGWCIGSNCCRRSTGGGGAVGYPRLTAGRCREMPDQQLLRILVVVVVVVVVVAVVVASSCSLHFTTVPAPAPNRGWCALLLLLFGGGGKHSQFCLLRTPAAAVNRIDLLFAIFFLDTADANR